MCVASIYQDAQDVQLGQACGGGPRWKRSLQENFLQMVENDIPAYRIRDVASAMKMRVVEACFRQTVGGIVSGGNAFDPRLASDARESTPQKCQQRINVAMFLHTFDDASTCCVIVFVYRQRCFLQLRWPNDHCEEHPQKLEHADLLLPRRQRIYEGLRDGNTEVDRSRVRTLKNGGAHASDFSSTWLGSVAEQLNARRDVSTPLPLPGSDVV